MLFKHHCAPSAVVAAPFDPASAIVVVTGTPGVIPLRDGEVPRTHGFTAMQATQLLGIDGAEYFRRAAAGLVGKANVWPAPGREFPDSKVAGQVAAVIQYASPELAGRAIAKLANGPGAAYGFMIDSHGDAAALDKALLGLAAMRGEALMHDPAVRPAGKIVEGIPGRIELMVTKADLKAVIDAREAFSQTRSNYDTASLVSPVAGVVGHLAGSVRADEWERTGGTMHRTGKVLKAFEAINRLHAEFGNGTYRKLELDVPSAVTSVSYSADPEQAKAMLLKAVSLSDVRRQEVEAARSMARAPQSRSGARSAAGMG